MPPKGQPTEGAIQRQSPAQRLIRRMSEIAVLDSTERRVNTDEINAILTAETEADMWSADDFDGWNAQKLDGTDLQITGFEVRFGESSEEIKSMFVDDDGKQMFLLVHAFRITEHKGEDKTLNLPKPGTEFTFNTSAPRVVGKIFWLLDHGYFETDHAPIRVRIQNTKLTGGRGVVKIHEFEGKAIISAPIVEDEPAF